MSRANNPLTIEQRTYSRKVAGMALVISCAISAAGYYIGIAPALAGLVERRSQEQELADRRGKMSHLSLEMSDTRRRLLTAGKELADLPLRLEPATAVNRRINWLAGVASEANVTLDEIQPQAAIDGPHYQTVPIRVAGSGAFPACAAFLHNLRNRFPDTSVRSFDIQNATPGRQGNVATFRIELDWHTTSVAR